MADALDRQRCDLIRQADDHDPEPPCPRRRVDVLEAFSSAAPTRARVGVPARVR